MTLDRVQRAGALALTLLVAAWFAAHFFLRTCAWRCRDSVLAGFVREHGYGLLVEFAASGEVVLAVAAVVGLAVGWLRDRLPV